MEIVSKPDLSLVEEAKAFPVQTAVDPALSRDLRRQYGRGLAARDVNVSMRAAGRAPRHPLRDQNDNSSVSSARRSTMRPPPDRTSSRMAERSSRRRGCSVPGQRRDASMRNKEEAHDYRYFPDPDLLPLELTQDLVDALKRDLARKLPDEAKGAFHWRDFGLSATDADVLVAERDQRLLLPGRWSARPDGGSRDASSRPTG